MKAKKRVISIEEPKTIRLRRGVTFTERQMNRWLDGKEPVPENVKSAVFRWTLALWADRVTKISQALKKKRK